MLRALRPVSASAVPRRPCAARALLPAALLILAATGAAEEIDCPKGTTAQGVAPPRGQRLWCAGADGVQQGPSLVWHGADQLAARATFRDGRLHGRYEAWYRDGTRKEQGEYRDDRREGLYTTFHPNGRKASEEEYRAGVLHGRQEVWFPNGGRFAISEYRDGKRDGPAATWYENGQKQTEGRFVAGVYHGRWVGWWEDGSLKKEAEFDHGKELSRTFHGRAGAAPSGTGSQGER